MCKYMDSLIGMSNLAESHQINLRMKKIKDLLELESKTNQGLIESPKGKELWQRFETYLEIMNEFMLYSFLSLSPQNDDIHMQMRRLLSFKKIIKPVYLKYKNEIEMHFEHI